MGHQARKDPRAKVLSMTVRYRSATLGEFIEHHSYDVSRGGMFIKTPSPFPAGTLLKFEVKIAEEQRVMQGVGRVVWKRESEGATEDEPAGMGIKFIKIDEASRSVIERLVDRRGPDSQSAYDHKPGEPTGKQKKMFPDTESGDQPAPEDRTVMKPANELLEDALKKAGEGESRPDRAAGGEESGAKPQRPGSESGGFEPVTDSRRNLEPGAGADGDSSVEEGGSESSSAEQAEVPSSRRATRGSDRPGSTRPSDHIAPRSRIESEDEGGGGRAIVLLLIVAAAAFLVYFLTKEGQKSTQTVTPEPPAQAVELDESPSPEEAAEAEDAELAVDELESEPSEETSDTDDEQEVASEDAATEKEPASAAPAAKPKPAPRPQPTPPKATSPSSTSEKPAASSPTKPTTKKPVASPGSGSAESSTSSTKSPSGTSKESTPTASDPSETEPAEGQPPKAESESSSPTTEPEGEAPTSDDSGTSEPPEENPY